MEYNNPSEIVKSLDFGDNAKNKVIAGVEKLAKAVKSTLGASGKCVVYEDGRGKPVITKDGVTVAQSVVLYDPVENIGATLIKEAAQNTVKEAGDGTTTATVLAESLIKTINSEHYNDVSIRDIKQGLNSGLEKVNNYLNSVKIDVKDELLHAVSTISCNNDAELGKIIAEAYSKVGKNGVVFMEESETNETYVDIVEGVQLDVGLTSPHWVTNTEKHKCELENPYILIVYSEIPNIRRIQNVLEHVIKKNRSLLIVAPVAQQVKAALLTNKVKGNIKVNVVDLPGFGPTKRNTCEDLAVLTGATVIDEQLGDDLDLISPEHLGEADLSVTEEKTTVITTIDDVQQDLPERIKHVSKLISNEKNGFIKKKLEQRLSMLSGSVGIIKVGADSKVELKEKKDRVEDAIYATKAALKEGIVSGGGVALLDASTKITADAVGEEILLKSITAPYKTILNNAGIETPNMVNTEGKGVNVVTGEKVNMIESGIIDPVLVTKSALKNAVSVVSTIVSADCVISNMRLDESDK
jgi:chaperonin GroEL